MVPIVKETVGLSRVQVYHSMCVLTFPSEVQSLLFFSIMFMNVATLLACAQSADNVFLILE